MTSPSETGVIRRVTIEATGGHRELQAIATAVMQAVEKLRSDAREYSQHFIPNVSTRPPAFLATAVINLEGTIKVEMEDEL